MLRRFITTLALVLGMLASTHSAVAVCAMAESGPCCCHENEDIDCTAVRTGPCCCRASAPDRHTTVAEAPRLDPREALAALLLPTTQGLPETQPRGRVLPPVSTVRTTAGPPLFLQSGALLI